MAAHRIASASLTFGERPRNPLRMSVWPFVNQTFTPLGTGIIADPAHNRECATRLRVDVAVHAHTATAAQLNRHISTLPAGLRSGRGFLTSIPAALATSEITASDSKQDATSRSLSSRDQRRR